MDLAKTPEIPWKTIKYPVTDLSKYKIKVDGFANLLVIDDKRYELDAYSLNNDDQTAYDKILTGK